MENNNFKPFPFEQLKQKKEPEKKETEKKNCPGLHKEAGARSCSLFICFQVSGNVP